MTENISPLRTINELLEYSFFIPSYQRGYRWDSQQVKDLLNDIDKFDSKEIKDSKDKTWYCLQPLVVKHCNTESIEAHGLNSNENWYEVIDGQQRLTTIFLIVHYINEMWKGKQKLKEFSLKYQTREKGSGFLKGLQIDESIDSIEVDTSNIDFYHISSAYKTIHKWVKSIKNLNTGEFESKFIHYTKIIWYESMADSIDIFTRINMGKIRLTNAELIKALFLNFKKEKRENEENKEKIRLKQLEIASEWDRMELTLQNNAFWYFLNKGTNLLTNRIEFIFNLMVLKDKKLEILPKDDEYFTFRYFSDKFKNKTDTEISDNWKQIKKIYQILEEWFEDSELYHKIGFLVTADVKIKNLIIDKENSESKIDFLIHLNNKINDKISVIKDKVCLPLEELEYPKHNDAIKNILLLHNIQSILNSNIKQNRFPFDIYNDKKENWDIEHIHPVTEQMPKTEKHQQEWLKETSKLIKDDTLRIKAEIYKKETFEGIYQEILNHFSESNKHEDINDLSNLALLNAKINRGYGNAVFLDKRNEIIENDKKGTFIPLCTKNIFMKYYTGDIEQITFWGENDRIAYLNNIRTTLNSSALKTISNAK